MADGDLHLKTYPRHACLLACTSHDLLERRGKMRLTASERTSTNTTVLLRISEALEPGPWDEPPCTKSSLQQQDANLEVAGPVAFPFKLQIP